MGRILLAGFEPSPDSAGIEGRAREIRMAGLTDFLRDFPPSVAIIYTGYKNAAGRVDGGFLDGVFFQIPGDLFQIP